MSLKQDQVDLEEVTGIPSEQLKAPGPALGSGVKTGSPQKRGSAGCKLKDKAIVAPNNQIKEAGMEAESPG